MNDITKEDPMLDRGTVQDIVLHALETLNDERRADDKLVVGPKTRLFGADAELDSLALVSVIVDVEEAVSKAAGRTISLTDDRAMSQDVSPYTDVDALTAYVVELLAAPA
jgi:acyl carrier protein